MRLLVVGGGTAGHVLPALPVIALMQARGAKVSFVGGRSGLEERLVAEAGVDFHAISAGKLRRYLSLQNLLDLFRIVAGVWQSIWLVRRLRPDVVFSKGGFVSFPVALASWLWRIPLVAHESDLTPGLANRLVLPFVDTLCVSFADTRVSSKVRVVHSGTPLRPAILQGDAASGRRALSVPGDRRLLLVTGGSLGADKLNAAIRDALPRVLPKYEVLHVCGSGKIQPMDVAGYTQVEYVDQGWGDMLAAADIVVSRAGANALFELLVLGKLNLLVPLSARASRGDQLDNAAYAAQRGYSKVLQEEDLDTPRLVTALEYIDEHRTQYQRALSDFAAPDAAAIIADELWRAGTGAP